MKPEQQLEIISQAWGRQDGYVFFPRISGSAQDREQRIRSYDEGPAYHWPEQKTDIIEFLKSHTDDDVYWCPSIFEVPRRKMEHAMDEHCLWADLDEADPRAIDQEYKPTIAWETSPGRYQSLWLIQRGFDIQGASWAGGENQRMTHFVGADQSGWDTTQLLRLPGWKNHKPDHREANGGEPPEGKLLWWDKGRRYLPDHFSDLPEVDHGTRGMSDILEDEVDRVDRHAVWGRVRLKVNKAVRDYMSAREVSGDRSEVLWQIERELADAGCSVTEIVALVRTTPWNKYAGRGDELRRLTSEAHKAVAARSEEVEEQLELEANRPKPQRIGLLLKNIPKPVWLIDGIWTEGACGFIAGQPKSYKSWMGFDLAMSMATGMPFLGHFAVRKPGPTLYIQEEDGAPILKQRADKIWPGKQADKMKLDESGMLVWDAPADMGTLENAPLDAYIREGFVISDPSWQSWLDETLAEGEYVMVVLDPLMMMAGDVEENRAQEMTSKVFRPLKQLAEKHKTAICLVHHMRKQGQATQDTRGGQLMLGSVANHAWAEDSLYVKLQRGELLVERESKHTTSGSFKLSNIRNKEWKPVVMDERGDLDEHDEEDAAEVRKASTKSAKRTRSPASGRQKGTGGSKIKQALDELGPGEHTTRRIADAAGISIDGARKQLGRAAGIIQSAPGRWKASA